MSDNVIPMRPTPSPKLRCPGIGRVGDNSKALIFYFDRAVTDDEMRFLHEVVQRAVAMIDRGAL